MDWKTSFLLDLTRHWISLSGRWFRWLSDPSVRRSSRLLLDSPSDHAWRCVTDDPQRFVVLDWPTGSRCSIVSSESIIPRRRKSSKTTSNAARISSKKCVLVDQSIDLGDIVIRKYTPARQNQAQCIISFYCSESDKPIYVIETGGRKIAKDPSCHARTFHGCLSARYVGLGYVQRRAALRSTARDSN